MDNKKIIKKSIKNDNFDQLLDQELIFAASEAIISESKIPPVLLEQSFTENLFRNKENQLKLINRITANPETIKKGDDQAINNILLKPIFNYLAQNYSDWISGNSELKKLFTDEELSSIPMQDLNASIQNHAFIHIFDIDFQGWFFDRDTGDRKVAPSVPKVNKQERRLFNKFSALASSSSFEIGEASLQACNNSLERLEKIRMTMMIEKKRRDLEKPIIAGFKSKKDFEDYKKQSSDRMMSVKRQQFFQNVPGFFSGMTSLSRKILKKTFLDFDEASSNVMGSAAHQIVFANFAKFPELSEDQNLISDKKTASLASFINREKIAQLELTLSNAIQKPNIGDSQFDRQVPNDEMPDEKYSASEIIEISKQVLSKELVSPDDKPLADWYFSEKNDYLVSEIEKLMGEPGMKSLVKKIPILILKTGLRSGPANYENLYDMSSKILSETSAKQKHALLMYLAKKDFDESDWGRFYNIVDNIGLVVAGITIFVAPLLIPAEMAAVEAGKRVAFQKLREKIVKRLGKELSEKILYTIGIVDVAEITAQGFRATYVINTEERESIRKVIDAISKVKSDLPGPAEMKEILEKEDLDKASILEKITTAEKLINNLNKMSIEAVKDTKIAEILIKNSKIGSSLNVRERIGDPIIAESIKELRKLLQVISEEKPSNLLDRAVSIGNFYSEWNIVVNYIQSYIDHYEKLGQEVKKHKIWMPERALQNENLLREKNKKNKQLTPAQKQHRAKLAFSKEHQRFAVRNFWTRGATAENHQVGHEVIHANLKILEGQIEVIERSLGMDPKSLFVSSGFRDLQKNNKVKSMSTSQHRLGKAADLYPRGGLTALKLYARIINLINTGKLYNGGVGIYKNFVHYDIRNKPSRWYNDQYKAKKANSEEIKNAIAADLQQLNNLAPEPAKKKAVELQKKENKITGGDAEQEDSKEIAKDAKAPLMKPATVKAIPAAKAKIKQQDIRCSQDYYSIEKMRAGIVHVFKGGEPCKLSGDYRYRISTIFGFLKNSFATNPDYSFAFKGYNELSSYCKKRTWNKVSKLIKKQQNWLISTKKKDPRASMREVAGIGDKIKSNLLYSVSNYVVDINLGSMLGRGSLTDTVCITYMKTSDNQVCPIVFLAPRTENFSISTWYLDFLKDGFGVISPKKNHDAMLGASTKNVNFVKARLNKIKKRFEKLLEIYNLNQESSLSKTSQFIQTIRITKQCILIVNKFNNALDSFLNNPNHETLTQVVKAGFVLGLITRSYYT